MIRVAAVTSGRRVPSSRFRVRQHIAPLGELGFDVHEHFPAIDKYAPLPAWPADRNVRWAPHFMPWQTMKLAARVPALIEAARSAITWLEREMLPARYTFERFLREPIAFDVDDAIWLASPAAAKAAQTIARRSDVVLAGNSFIADWFSTFADDVRIVPTAVDTERFRPAGDRNDDNFTVGWTGSASTLRYLEAVEEPLRALFRDHPCARLLVIADRAPAFVTLDPERVQFVPWSESVETEALGKMNVGIMPLADDEWSRGKCSFKMLQYMSAGVPVVVTPVGMNKEVLARGEVGFSASRDAEWQEALRTLAADRGLAARMGAEGRRVVETRYSVDVVCRQIAAAFTDLAGATGSS